jgi:hypothetical protein
MKPRNRFQGIDYASLHILAGRYEYPIPNWFLASIDCSKIPALFPGHVSSSMPERTERFIEDQAFLRLYDSAPRPLPPHPTVSKLDRRHTGRVRNRGKLLTGERGEGEGVRSQIIRPQESLVLSKSFNPLCCILTILPWLRHRT